MCIAPNSDTLNYKQKNRKISGYKVSILQHLDTRDIYKGFALSKQNKDSTKHIGG